MQPLIVGCLAPALAVLALGAVVLMSMHRWPGLWPESLSAVVLGLEVSVKDRWQLAISRHVGDRGVVASALRAVAGANAGFARWPSGAEGRLTLYVGAVAFLACVAGLFCLRQPVDTLWNRAAFPVMAVAATVFAVDFLYRSRTRRWEKEWIVRNMGSRNNHTALDAARAVVDRQWHIDGSLAGTVYERADLRGLSMARAKLAAASFMYAKLADAELMFADLRGAKLGSADLRNANLSFSALDGAVLGLADLENASLGRCSLRFAHLEGANLRGAFLEHADLNGARLEQAIYNAKTRWPEGFMPPAGAINWDTLSDTERDWFRQWRWYLA